MNDTLQAVEKILNYKFKDSRLLDIALTHSSYSNENANDTRNGGTHKSLSDAKKKRTREEGGSANYERLEFLGDSILNYCISEYIFQHQKTLAEGEMTKKRAMIVCENTAYQCAYDLGLSPHIKIGNCLKNDFNINKSIAADVIEALIAAIYLDSDIETAKTFILRLFQTYIENPEDVPQTLDYKTTLQEYCQKHFSYTPVYALVEETGPEHQRVFAVKVSHEHHFSEVGKGRTKKEAAQEAAKKVLLKLKVIQ